MNKEKVNKRKSFEKRRTKNRKRRRWTEVRVWKTENLQNGLLLGDVETQI